MVVPLKEVLDSLPPNRRADIVIRLPNRGPVKVKSLKAMADST